MHSNDSDRSGGIDWPEFLELITNSLDFDGRYVFDHFFDGDRNGTIDFTELKRVLDYLSMDATDDEVSAMIRVADSDGDGHISYSEFQV